MFKFCIGGPTDELHPFTNSSETGLGLIINSIALFSVIRQVQFAKTNKLRIQVSTVILITISGDLFDLKTYVDFESSTEHSSLSKLQP